MPVTVHLVTLAVFVQPFNSYFCWCCSSFFFVSVSYIALYTYWWSFENQFILWKKR